MKISIIIPYLITSRYIGCCKYYLKKNTYNDFEIIEIINKADVYKCYNDGVKKAKNTTIVMMNDDMIPSENWDKYIEKYFHENCILTFNVIEPGNLPINKKNYFFNAGEDIDNFDYEKFKNAARIIQKNQPEIIRNYKGWYMPIVYNKENYIPYPNKKKFPYPNDIILIDKILPKEGRKFAKLNSCFYHFQHKSS